ncbi:MAG: hypothetical protein U1E16_11000 [Hyphomicrobiales bacterium]
MKAPLLILAAAAAGSWTLPATATQQVSSCANHDEIVKVLAQRYHEAPRAIGLASRSAVIEVFTSKSGTWTILLTKTDGASCILAAGSNWEENPPVGNMTSL